MSKVRVSIGAAEVVKYHRYIEMEQTDYDRLLAALDSDERSVRRRAEEEIQAMLDPKTDANDWDDFEVNIFEVRA